MNGHGREGGLDQQAVQRIGTSCRLHEDHDLVELKGVEQVNQLSVLLVLLQLGVELLETVQGQACLVVNRNLERLLHELFAGQAYLLI